MPAPGGVTSFLVLMDLHRELEEAFLRHQEALLALNVAEALRRLTAYEQALLEHMRHEEEGLIPVYAARAERIRGGPVELFLGEHRKMREFLESLTEDLERMRGLGGTELRRAVIALFDREAMYKHLVEHHDRREQNILYPELDRITSEGERAALLVPMFRGTA
jgi:hemerythrin-like domain-containing protein